LSVIEHKGDVYSEIKCGSLPEHKEKMNALKLADVISGTKTNE